MPCLVRRGERADARRILVRLVSSALTGFFYTTSRTRLADKLQMMKYDPVGESRRIVDGRVAVCAV